VHQDLQRRHKVPLGGDIPNHKQETVRAPQGYETDWRNSKTLGNNATWREVLEELEAFKVKI